MSNNRGRFDIFEIVVISLLLPISVGVIVNIITPKILSPDKNQNPGPQVQNPPVVMPTPTYTPTPMPSHLVSVAPSHLVSAAPSPPVSVAPSPSVSVAPSPPVSVPPSSGPYTEIKSDVGAEAQLKELEKLLKQGDFKAADEKTGEIMLYVANREKEGWIDSDSMEKFPCTDLRTIDQLWLNNSNGRFGFSVQKRIFEENGKDREKWGDAIGWREGGKWKELTFQKNAEKGHLPDRQRGGESGAGSYLDLFESMLVRCSI